MRIIIWCIITFICGLLGGVLFSWWPPLFAPGSSAEEAAAFRQWQEAASAAKGQVEFKTRDKLLLLMAPSDGPRAWQMLMQSGSKPRITDIEQVARQWARRDGRAATSFGGAIGDPIERHAFLTVALSCWFGREPRIFLEWLKTQPDKESIVGGMTYSEYGSLIKPEAASLDALAVLYAGSQGRQAQLRNLVMRVWRYGNQKQAVMDWLRRQPESEQRDYAWRDIANDLAPTDSQAAAALAGEVTSPNIRRYLASTVAAWMAKTDVPAALAYAESLPDDDSRNSAWQSAFGTWLKNDPVGALGHVRQHLDTITTDKVQSALGMEMAMAADELSLLRLMKGSEQSRDSIVERIFSQWKGSSREDLRSWLTSPEAEWLAPDKLKRYREMAEQPTHYGGSVSRTVNGRRVCVGS